MKHTTQSDFGRPMAAVQSPSQGPDKWTLLANLTEAAETFELSHRTLTVLKALLTFLPTREIPAGAQAIVFPSNSTLSRRLSGMPESTLRRHLSKLVKSGIVSRHDSPNRKRYARRIGARTALAFGFDLTPLALLDAQLEERAEQARQQRAALCVLRDDVMCLRARLIAGQGESDLTDEIARILRRKPALEILQAARETLTGLVDSAPASPDLSAPDSRNERHIQNTTKYDFDSEKTQKPPKAERAVPVERAGGREEGIDLKRVTRTCQAFRDFFPDLIRGWHDLVAIGDRISPMLGIDTPVLHHAKRVMGVERAAVVILCILEKAQAVRNPGGYLRHLTKLAGAGGFSVIPMLRALE
ncbi:MAG: plasmid replication protein RepC [Sulfitobacter sp.]|nr:plasmid replication protein RepC [Sulfitobacter sp.]